MDQNNNALSIQLLDSTFTKEEAYEVMMALLDHKITFHQRKRFSDRERFNKDLSKSELRIQELKQEQKRLKEFFNKLEGDSLISVSSLVDLGVEEEKAEQKTA